jgi:hypothetical protein
LRGEWFDGGRDLFETVVAYLTPRQVPPLS